jgi:predicted RNA polymerase sigma factor
MAGALPTKSLKGDARAARASYECALELARQPAERRFLEGRLAQLATEVSACSS